MATKRGVIAVGVLIGAGVVALHLRAQSPDGGLCTYGHPSHRRADVTYGHLPTRPGMVRDHVVPLCLGGPDVASNIQYQTYAEGHLKDEREWRACEAYCRNPSTALLDQLRAEFHRTESR